MLDSTTWIVTEEPSGPSLPEDIPSEAALVAIEITMATKRYPPASRVVFLNRLISELSVTRDIADAFIQASESHAHTGSAIHGPA